MAAKKRTTERTTKKAPFKVEVVRDLFDSEGADYEVTLVAPDGWRAYVTNYPTRAQANAHASRLRLALRPIEPAEGA